MGAELDVDGDRPAVRRVAAIPRGWGLTPLQRLVLLALACDSYDGLSTAPGLEAVAGWCGSHPSTVREAIAALERATDSRPALLRREDARGGRRASIVLLIPEPTVSAGGSHTREPAESAGGSVVHNPPTPPVGNPPTNPPGNPPTNPPILPVGNPPTNPPAESAPPLPSYPLPSPGDAIRELAQHVPAASEATALPAAFDDAIAKGWTPTEWVDAVRSRCRSTSPAGTIVGVARTVVHLTPPSKRAADHARSQADDAARMRDQLAAVVDEDHANRYLDEAARVLGVPRDSRPAALEALTNANHDTRNRGVA